MAGAAEANTRPASEVILAAIKKFSSSPCAEPVLTHTPRGAKKAIFDKMAV